jgi:uncharacterized protein YmfQ (DUF2313 family)
MKRLEQRIARLEARHKQPDTSKPSEEEHDAARGRNLARAKARLTGEPVPGDSPEQAAKDAEIIRRWERVEGIGAEDMAGLAEQVREKLRSVGSRVA